MSTSTNRTAVYAAGEAPTATTATTAIVDDGGGDDDRVVLECRNPTLIERSPNAPSLSSISISTAYISSWHMPTILNHQTVIVSINRSRLIEESGYFRTLLAGNFSESSKCCIAVYWSLEMFLPILRFMHGYHMEITLCSFLPLIQAALYFGSERLVLHCEAWFCGIMSEKGLSSQKLHLDDLIHFRDFGLENAMDWVVEHCTSYVAKNFMWAMSCDAFVDLPYSFIISCVKHPQLTVYSERHLCEALLAWFAAKIEPIRQSSGFEDVWVNKFNQMNIERPEWSNILEEIRVDLLPLWFIMGKCRCNYFSVFAKDGVSNIFGLMKKLSKDPNFIKLADDRSYLRIRLTENSKKLDLSGCPQLTSAALLLSLFHNSDSPSMLNVIRKTTTELEYPNCLSLSPILSFKAMAEVDISKCSQLHLDTAMKYFKKSFPSLRIIRMAYFLGFETNKFCDLMVNSTVSEVDLKVDISPLLPSNISSLYSESESRSLQKNYFGMSSRLQPRPTIPNISKLTLEGRTDFSDSELLDIAECCNSLIYLNIRGCLSVTDIGIANFILRCVKLHSIIASDTSFGRNSISALCYRGQGTAKSPSIEVHKEHLKLSDINLQLLHIGGCKGICETSLVHLLSKEHKLKSLCLRDTFLIDDSLYRFPGSSLEMLDVSNTVVSRDALAHVVMKNPGLKNLVASGCKSLCLQWSKNSKDSLSPHDLSEKFFLALGKECRLEKLTIGWGFSDLSVNDMAPALTSLKALTVGLGGSLGSEGLNQLCILCPLLESVSITFQVISDAVITNLLVTSRKLQALSICYCIGDVSPLALNCKALHLRKLKLERVTPWMTNDNLALLTENCANLMELSLVGCIRLDVDAQRIISSGWPGLISLHLEDCGSVTAGGVDSLLDCKAMEDLLLRHNGCGIKRNFIIHAASELHMLRSLSLDWCDASEGDLDLPNFSDRCFLSNVKIARCTLKKCSLDFHNKSAPRRPVHKETLVLVWNSMSLQKTLVRERIT
ncbi:hypothetical protein vseg_013228 [Gypsophila vaccaria]